MVDYTKIRLCNIDEERLLGLDCLNFVGKFSRSTGEINEKKLVAEYHHCKIVVYSFEDMKTGATRYRIVFSGSIHKMWNSLNEVLAPNYKPNRNYTGYNGNQFTLNDILSIRAHLQKLFDCKASQMIFESIEFGINSLPEFSPILFLKGLLYLKNVAFEFKYKGNYAQAEFQRYVLKIYNKSYQYGIAHSVLRIELRFRKMIELNRFGIVSFADINEQTLAKAGDYLLQQFTEVMYFDYTIDTIGLKTDEVYGLDKYANVNYWLSLAPNRRDKPKKHLKRLIENYSSNLKQELERALKERSVMINQSRKASRNVMNNHSSLKLTVTQMPLLICKVTGLDISMQKQGSILLSHTGLMFYHSKYPKTFAELKRRFLSKLWLDASLKIQIKEIAHNIRNIRCNRARKTKRQYPAEQHRLFVYD